MFVFINMKFKLIQIETRTFKMFKKTNKIKSLSSNVLKIIHLNALLKHICMVKNKNKNKNCSYNKVASHTKIKKQTNKICLSL